MNLYNYNIYIVTRIKLVLMILKQELNQIFEVFMGQLRQLFGLKSTGFYKGTSGTSVLLSSQRGFTEW